MDRMSQANQKQYATVKNIKWVNMWTYIRIHMRKKICTYQDTLLWENDNQIQSISSQSCLQLSLVELKIYAAKLYNAVTNFVFLLY